MRNTKFFLIVLLTTNAFARPAPEVIYGNDDRKDPFEVTDGSLLKAANSTVAVVASDMVAQVGDRLILKGPIFKDFKNLCADERFREQLTSADCSGFLVSSNMVATAGHCISSDSACGTEWYIFNYGIYSAGSKYFDQPLSNGYRCKRVVKRVYSSKEDFALIELDRPVIDRDPIKVRESGVLTKADELFLIGHPVGIPTKIAGGGHLRDHYSGFFKANLDAYGGNSGSLVLNHVTNEAEGILVRGAPDFLWDSNRGCYTSNVCGDNECTGESVTTSIMFKDYIK